MQPHWVVYCICFHVIVLCISNNCIMYYDFFSRVLLILPAQKPKAKPWRTMQKKRLSRRGKFFFPSTVPDSPSNVLRLNMQRNNGDLLIRLCLCLCDIYNNLAAFPHTCCNEVLSITTSHMLYCCFHYCNLLTFDLKFSPKL